MKKILVAAAVAVIVMAGSAFAASGSANVGVTAIVNASSYCNNFKTNAVALTIDTLVPGDVFSTGGNTSAQCTNNAPFTVSASSQKAGTTAINGATGLSGKVDDGSGNQINYTLYFVDSFTGAGLGIDKVFFVGTGSATTGVKVANADVLSNPPTGTYTDTVTFTVTY